MRDLADDFLPGRDGLCDARRIVRAPGPVHLRNPATSLVTWALPLLTAVFAAIADAAYGLALGEADAPTAIAGRFASLRQDAGRLREAVDQQRAKLATRPWRLGLPRAAYAGRYRHPLLGTLEVRLRDDASLAIDWGVLHAVASAFDEAERMRVEFVPGSGQVVAFEVAADRPTALTFDGLRFTRVD